MEVVKGTTEYRFESPKELVAASIDGVEVQVDVTRVDLMLKIETLGEGLQKISSDDPKAAAQTIAAAVDLATDILKGLVGEASTKKLLKGNEQNILKIMSYLGFCARIMKKHGEEAINKTSAIFADIDNIIA